MHGSFYWGFRAGNMKGEHADMMQDVMDSWENHRTKHNRYAMVNVYINMEITISNGTTH